MNKVDLFVDGSVNVKSGIGFGAWLVVEDQRLSVEAHRKNVKVKRFEDTSSTRLELQILLWALDEAKVPNVKIVVHTDSQNTLGLLDRRNRLEHSDFRSKAGRPLNNRDLYRQFYDAIDSLDLEFVKLKGHKQSSQKGKLDDLFTLVDRAAREAQRKDATD